MPKSPRILSRRAALNLGMAAALPLVHVRTAGAAGKLKVAFADSPSPDSDEALRKAVEQWAMQNKVTVQVDFLSVSTNQVALTTAAEAQAKSGHDIMQGGFSGATTYAHLREPVDDVVGRLQERYGAFNDTVEYAGKVDGHWHSVPAYFLSGLYPCVARIDVFKQVVGMDLQRVFPADPDMGPGYEEWTWDAFLKTAEKCAKAGVPFGLPISSCDDANAWLSILFRSYGAELVNAEGKITVNSDAVRTVLEYLKRLAPYLPSDVYSWDNNSNNRALIAGRSALILNPPSAWAQAVKNQPQIGSQCWHFPPPAGPKGRFINYIPYFWGIWSFSTNKSAAKELLEWLSQRERAEQICTAGHGYDIPPFLSMSDLKVWEDEGPPRGTLYNYPIKPGHHAQANLAIYPAPLSMASTIYSRAIMPTMVATMIQRGDSIDQAIAWAERELQGLRR